jgi:hypothetical protein
LPNKRRAKRAGVDLPVRYSTGGMWDLDKWAGACKAGDCETLEALQRPNFATLRYPIIPSKWTGPDLARVAALMAAILNPPATEIMHCSWQGGELTLIVAAARDSDGPPPSVQLRATNVPMPAVFEFLGGRVHLMKDFGRLPLTQVTGGAR